MESLTACLPFLRRGDSVGSGVSRHRSGSQPAFMTDIDVELVGNPSGMAVMPCKTVPLAPSTVRDACARHAASQDAQLQSAGSGLASYRNSLALGPLDRHLGAGGNIGTLDVRPRTAAAARRASTDVLLCPAGTGYYVPSKQPQLVNVARMGGGCGASQGLCTARTIDVPAGRLQTNTLIVAAHRRSCGGPPCANGGGAGAVPARILEQAPGDATEVFRPSQSAVVRELLGPLSPAPSGSLMTSVANPLAGRPTKSPPTKLPAYRRASLSSNQRQHHMPDLDTINQASASACADPQPRSEQVDGPQEGRYLAQPRGETAEAQLASMERALLSKAGIATTEAQAPPRRLLSGRASGAFATPIRPSCDLTQEAREAVGRLINAKAQEYALKEQSLPILETDGANSQDCLTNEALLRSTSDMDLTICSRTNSKLVCA
uniref:Uncharacterized protein n=1 Tax=Chlamydomonas euryale TaxID=1486919 RepID=A0A7R9W1Q1_9CHLO|mmetsp:Transcript_9090/g.27676  ORF Transcript_9090/g.27676 Transcript_9090/m.27676 type:complete len:434 (+) Transcript_9090:32-1333(+)